MDKNLTRQIIDVFAKDLPLEQQIVVLAEKVRDIPYGTIGSRDPGDVYTSNKGTCSGKHELLKELYQELGIEVKDYLIMHRFKELGVEFPEHIMDILNRTDVVDPHNFFKILFNGKWITVDITWDSFLEKYGFPINKNWDGQTDMKLCVAEGGEVIETENPIELKKELLSKLPTEVQNDRKLFLEKVTE